jgi:antitoxin (DNA-binding transcriptional repressor) of toxin-antitoxin stability system
MLEVTVARLRSSLAFILEVARAGEPVVIRRHGARIAILTGLDAQDRREASRRALGGPSKLPVVQDTGAVRPVKVRGRMRRSPSEELSQERD